jgi:hypothetical protein
VEASLSSYREGETILIVIKMVVLVSACGGFKLWVEVDGRPLEIYRRTAVVGEGQNDNVQGYFVAEPGAVGTK